MLLPVPTLSVSSALALNPTDWLSVVRQQTTPDSAPPHQRSVWIIICVVLAVLLFVVVSLLVVRLMLRTRRLSEATLEDTDNGASGRHADRERLVFAYLPAQAPAIVRMQRLAKKAGLSQQELDSVAPVSAYSRQSSESHLDANKSGDHVCAVCLEDMVDGRKTRRLPCGHWFDADCIDVWATKANRCPVCNANIIDEEELERRRLGTSEASDQGVRQRRRRTRGENGTFELAIVNEHNFLASESNVPSTATAPNVVNGSP